MNYKVVTIGPFDKDLKWLVKKYPSLEKQIGDLISDYVSPPNDKRLIFSITQRSRR